MCEKIIFYCFWILWASSGWIAIYLHNKKHPGIFWPALCFFAIFFGPMMFAESEYMEKRQKWHNGEIGDDEYFGKPNWFDKLFDKLLDYIFSKFKNKPTGK